MTTEPTQTVDDATEIAKWYAEIEKWYCILLREMPHIDPHDLRMILRSLLQPPCVERRWLLRKTEDGRYVL